MTHESLRYALAARAKAEAAKLRTWALYVHECCGHEKLCRNVLGK
jgi:hypothetical protein